MSTPQRVWKRRTKGWRMPSNTVSVTRPGPWGNLFGVHPHDGGQAAAVAIFRDWLAGKYPNSEPKRREWILKNLPSIRGKNLACFCEPGTPCHADVLLELANK